MNDKLAVTNLFIARRAAFFYPLGEKCGLVTPGLEERYRQVRAEQLERATARLCREFLPSAAMVSTNVKWRLSGSDQTFETDLIILIDDVLIVVECKSGAIGAHGGRTRRLRGDIKKLVASPSNQCERLVANLSRLDGIDRNSKATVAMLERAQIERTICFAVTLENLGPAGAATFALGYYPAISLHDLRTILEALPFESMRVHYLSRRSDLDVGHALPSGCEMDRLGIYAETCFCGLGSLDLTQTWGVGMRMLRDGENWPEPKTLRVYPPATHAGS